MKQYILTFFFLIPIYSFGQIVLKESVEGVAIPLDQKYIDTVYIQNGIITETNCEADYKKISLKNDSTILCEYLIYDNKNFIKVLYNANGSIESITKYKKGKIQNEKYLFNGTGRIHAIEYYNKGKEKGKIIFD